MKVTTTARNYELTPALKDYAENKVLHLKRYFEQIVNAHITFSMEKYRNTVEITVHINGRDFKSKDVTEDMYVSVDGAVEKLERQILKHKGKRSRRKNQMKLKDTEEVFALEAEEVVEEEFGPPIEYVEATVEEFPALSPDDAVREMEGNGTGFKIFSNTETNKINVIYVREDGKVGFIEAK
jgi:putative sigma-54 modulation protein